MKSTLFQKCLSIMGLLSFFSLRVMGETDKPVDTTHPKEILTQIKLWQQTHPVDPATSAESKARWMMGLHAAYQVTADASFFNRFQDAAQSNVTTLPLQSDPVASLMTALPLIRLYALTTDSVSASTPAEWTTWWKNLSPLLNRTPRTLGAMATIAAMGANTPTHKIKMREAWFQALHEQLDLLLPTLVDPNTGLMQSKSGLLLSDQGEALWGLISILNDCPRSDPSWKSWAETTRSLAAALVAKQGKNGLWKVDLGTGSDDIMGSALVLAGLAAGVDHGLIDPVRTGPSLQRAWQAIVAVIAPSGNFDARSFSSSESGSILLAASGMVRLQRLLAPDGNPLPASSSPLIPACGLEAHPLAEQLTRLVQRSTKTPVIPTGYTKADYLRSISHLVAFYRQYQTPEGRIIDPLKKVEFHYATPMYAHAAATLVASGEDRSPAMLESAMRALDVTTSDLAATATMNPRKLAPGSDTNTSDFYIRPVMGAYLALKEIAPKERVVLWSSRLSGLDPKITYSMTDGNFSNWSLCLLWGEFLRNRQGWQPDSAIDHTLNIQRGHATPLGLYFEGHGPWAYDGFGRYFVVGMLADGYRGSEFDFWRDSSWRGAWTSLMVQAPNGEIPIGGRSAQHLWNEAQVAAIWERYAKAYAQAGRLVEAGMFKRAAHLALGETKRWLNADGSNQVTKNFYPANKRHGYMPYTHLATYSLLAASMLASAWEVAEDEIVEYATPAELGGCWCNPRKCTASSPMPVEPTSII